jgi:hypothetical protein
MDTILTVVKIKQEIIFNLVNAVMNLRVPWNAGNFLTS